MTSCSVKEKQELASQKGESMPLEIHVGKEKTGYPRKLGRFQSGWSTKLVMSRIGREKDDKS